MVKGILIAQKFQQRYFVNRNTIHMESLVTLQHDTRPPVTEINNNEVGCSITIQDVAKNVELNSL